MLAKVKFKVLHKSRIRFSIRSKFGAFVTLLGLATLKARVGSRRMQPTLSPGTSQGREMASDEGLKGDLSKCFYSR